MRIAFLLLLTLFAACDHVRPSPVGTNCVRLGRNQIVTCE